MTERYVNDGILWSSAGISAGIDMSLAVVKAVLAKPSHCTCETD